LAILAATASRSSSAPTVTGFLRITETTGCENSAMTRSRSETDPSSFPAASIT
jgi:hypothetical protein